MGSDPTFIIRELPVGGGTLGAIGSAITSARFEWDEVHRNIPFSPWDFGMTHKTARTDYPGVDTDPTEQMLGAHFEPFTLRGHWLDKYNQDFLESGGYAVRTWKAIEALVRRGSLCEIAFEDIMIQGVFTDAQFHYHNRGRIGYELTFSPHHRQPGGRQPRQPRTVLNARQLKNEVFDVYDRAVVYHAEAPKFFIAGTLYFDMIELISSWTESLASLGSIIDQRTVLPNFEPGAALRRIASIFRLLRSTGTSIITLARNARSDTDVSVLTGATILAFDVWLKGLTFEAGNMMAIAERAAREMESRADPPAKAIYHPYAGEHLYGISNRFYGTAFNWRRIATRNALGNEMTLTGTETLIIPEATSR